MFLAHLLQVHYVFLAHLLQVHHMFLDHLLRQVPHMFLDHLLLVQDHLFQVHRVFLAHLLQVHHVFLAHLLQSITCSWTISCGRHVPGPSVTGPSCVPGPSVAGPSHVPGPSVTGPSRVPGPSVAGPSHVPGPSVAGPSCLPRPSVAGPEFQDHAPVAGTNTVLHTSPSCSEETLQLACLESSMTSQHYKTVENEYSKNVTRKLLNAPRNIRLYVVPMTHLHFKLGILAKTRIIYSNSKNRHKRCFQVAWYSSFKWVILCTTQLKAFCFYCRFAAKRNLIVFSTKADNALDSAIGKSDSP